MGGFRLVLECLLLVGFFGYKTHAGNTTDWNMAVFEYHKYESCGVNEFYDLDLFACTPCSRNDKLQPSRNRFSCECANTVSTTSLFDIAKEHPSCADACEIDSPHNNTKVETVCQQELTTLKCKYKYINATDPTLIQFPESLPTKNVRLTFFNPDNGNCSFCNFQYNFRYQDYCIANALIKPYLKYNTFWEPGKYNMERFGDLKFVAFFCLNLHNVTACNQLANLCVASHFAADKHSPCSIFLYTQSQDAILRYSSIDEEQLMTRTRPFLYFRKGRSTMHMLNAALQNATGFTIDGDKTIGARNLQFFSVTYGQDGNPLRWGDFHLGHINLCQMQIHARREIVFGQQLTEECLLSLENLLEMAQLPRYNTLTSLFLNYSTTSVKSRFLLHTIPILIEDLLTNAQLSQPTEWHLVKRFLPIFVNPQNMLRKAARSALGAYEDSQKLLLFSSIRFIESFHIHYRIHSGNRISVPLVRLRYRHVLIRENSSLAQTYKFKLQVSFSKVDTDGSNANSILDDIILPLVLLMAIGTATLRTSALRKRRPISDFCDLSLLCEFIWHLFSHTANALLFFLSLHITFSSLTFYARRGSEVVIMPLDKDRMALEIIVFTAFILKSIHLSIYFWRASHYSLFFVDWERPRNSDSHHFNANLKSNLETASVCSSVRTLSPESSVSAWRILFTANEWIRLCGSQITSIWLQAFICLLLIKILNAPEVAHNDIILQLFWLSLLYTGVYCGQLLCVALFKNRLTGEPLRKFVDLCSLANVSVFILCEPSYGYYVHGRSPHGFADTDMTSMILQLQRESQNMCGRRGLLNDSDQQTYIIMPPASLWTYFQKLLIPLQRSCSISQAHVQKENGGSVAVQLERTSLVYSSVNRYLCAFIDHAIKDLDYIIKEKTLFEKLFRSEFEHFLTDNKGTFYIDKGYSFASLCLLGNELQLLIFQLVLLISLFLLTANSVTSLAVVCFTHTIFKGIFRCWVRQNVSAKTLVDKRFLI